MKTLYIECNMGAAGDMLMAALYEIIEDKEGFINKMNSLGIPGLSVEAQKSEKCGIFGTHMAVKIHGEEEHSHDHGHEHSHDHGHEHSHDHGHEHSHDHGHEHSHDHGHGHSHDHGHHHHADLHGIKHIFSHLDLSEEVKCKAEEVYTYIAKAESHAHNKPVEEVHFHEVGALDAVADVVGVCMLISELAPQNIVVSPINVGSGLVKCAHGILPVPAPATAHILADTPTYSNSVKGELCTPTGAALLKTFASEFSPQPIMRVEKIGYGMGTKDFEVANCVRVFLGETEEKPQDIVELACNLDDMTAEEIGFAMEKIFESGAVDVFTTPIGMKKSRPATMLTALCKQDVKQKVVEAVFKHTSTIGVRETDCKRYELYREQVEVNSEFGKISAKKSSGYGVEKIKLEYDDLAQIASDNNVSIQQIKAKIK